MKRVVHRGQLLSRYRYLARRDLIFAAAAVTLSSSIIRAASGAAFTQTGFSSTLSRPLREVAFLPTTAGTTASSRSSPAFNNHFERQNRGLFNPNRSQTRCFASPRNKDKEDGGFFGMIKSAAKSVLPASWFQSEEEKKAAIERKKVQEEISGGLDQMLKDAPLPIRMFGKMVGPLMSNMMSGLAETMAEQQQSVDAIMKQARGYIENDPQVKGALGEPVSVSAPFSQSSSSSSINGRTSTRVRLAFQVSGTIGTGIAQLEADETGIRSIEVQTNMQRSIGVNLSSGRGNKFTSGTSWDDGDIIEAEIVDKKSRK